MAYKSVAPSLNVSCYNCRHFVVSADMINGKCFFPTHSSGKSAIGIGTCEHFAVKLQGEESYPWSKMMKKKKAVNAAQAVSTVST